MRKTYGNPLRSVPSRRLLLSPVRLYYKYSQPFLPLPVASICGRPPSAILTAAVNELLGPTVFLSFTHNKAIITILKYPFFFHKPVAPFSFLLFLLIIIISCPFFFFKLIPGLPFNPYALWQRHRPFSVNFLHDYFGNKCLSAFFAYIIALIRASVTVP